MNQQGWQKIKVRLWFICFMIYWNNTNKHICCIYIVCVCKGVCCVPICTIWWELNYKLIWKTDFL